MYRTLIYSKCVFQEVENSISQSQYQNTYEVFSIYFYLYYIGFFINIKVYIDTFNYLKNLFSYNCHAYNRRLLRQYDLYDKCIDTQENPVRPISIQSIQFKCYSYQQSAHGHVGLSLSPNRGNRSVWDCLNPRLSMQFQWMFHQLPIYTYVCICLGVQWRNQSRILLFLPNVARTHN